MVIKIFQIGEKGTMQMKKYKLICTRSEMIFLVCPCGAKMRIFFLISSRLKGKFIFNLCECIKVSKTLEVESASRT